MGGAKPLRVGHASDDANAGEIKTPRTRTVLGKTNSAASLQQPPAQPAGHANQQGGAVAHAKGARAHQPPDDSGEEVAEREMSAWSGGGARAVVHVRWGEGGRGEKSAEARLWRVFKSLCCKRLERAVNAEDVETALTSAGITVHPSDLPGLCLCVPVCLCVCVSICLCVCVSICLCVYVCAYV